VTDWMVSEAGQAMAAWASCALAVVAVIFALSVALIEQRRANEERRIIAESEEKRRTTFVDAALNVSEQAMDLIYEAEGGQVDEDETGECYVAASLLSDELRPLEDTVASLRQATPFDADIAISMSKIFRAIEAAMNVSGANVLASRREWRRCANVLAEERNVLRDSVRG
jgi:hypothetical protein